MYRFSTFVPWPCSNVETRKMVGVSCKSKAFYRHFQGIRIRLNPSLLGDFLKAVGFFLPPPQTSSHHHRRRQQPPSHPLMERFRCYSKKTGIEPMLPIESIRGSDGDPLKNLEINSQAKCLECKAAQATHISSQMGIEKYLCDACANDFKILKGLTVPPFLWFCEPFDEIRRIDAINIAGGPAAATFISLAWAQLCQLALKKTTVSLRETRDPAELGLSYTLPVFSSRTWYKKRRANWDNSAIYLKDPSQ